nr:9410_t:CDS:2 [Entrophospora candida]CAG8662684.1 8083_t:CDS:2 [Entrophospora candida]
MPPKNIKKKEDTKAKNFNEVTKNILNWPKVSLKSNLELQTILSNQILIINSFFTSEECAKTIDFINNNIPLQSTANPSPKKGEAFRNNHRFSIEDKNFSRVLFNSGLDLLVSDWKSGEKTVSGLNHNIRIYKYCIGQKFGKHYDVSVKDSLGGLSQWTLLIYLNGGESESEYPLLGGETVFYKSKKDNDGITIKPQRGMALLHLHGHECLLHEGKEVKKGSKYVLRSDLMFS